MSVPNPRPGPALDAGGDAQGQLAELALAHGALGEAAEALDSEHEVERASRLAAAQTGDVGDVAPVDITGGGVVDALKQSGIALDVDKNAQCRFPFKLSLLDFHSVTDSSAGPLTHGRSAASTRSQCPSGGAGPSRVFGPFNWHNLAFDPFKLSPSASQCAMHESLCGVAP